MKNSRRSDKYVPINAYLCVTCGMKLISLHVHDFVMCPCGEFIDGGFDYCRKTMNLKPLELYMKVSDRRKYDIPRAM